MYTELDRDIFEGHALWDWDCSVGRRQKSDRDQYSQWGVNGTKLAIFSMLAVVYIFTVSSTYPR